MSLVAVHTGSELYQISGISCFIAISSFFNIVTNNKPGSRHLTPTKLSLGEATHYGPQKTSWPPSSERWTAIQLCFSSWGTTTSSKPWGPLIAAGYDAFSELRKIRLKWQRIKDQKRHLHFIHKKLPSPPDTSNHTWTNISLDTTEDWIRAHTITFYPSRLNIPPGLLYRHNSDIIYIWTVKRQFWDHPHNCHYLQWRPSSSIKVISIRERQFATICKKENLNLNCF